MKGDTIKKVINQLEGEVEKIVTNSKPIISENKVTKIIDEVMAEVKEEENIKPIVIDKTKLKYILNRVLKVILFTQI